ncbi:MAG: adenylate/guanylate cyclase domain-containing protein [Nevskiales bacterium]
MNLKETAQDTVLAELDSRWFGLRFCSRETEHEFRRWRIESAVPFARMGMAGVAVAWLCAMVIVAVGMPQHVSEFLTWIVFAILPVSAVVISVSYAPTLRAWLIPANMLGNTVGGLVAVWLTYVVAEVPGSAAGAAVIAMFFAFTIFRLPPSLASTAVMPFVVFVLYLLTRDFVAARLSMTEFAAYAMLPITSFVAGVLVCALMEYMTRRAYRSERIIEHQQQALLEERAQLSKFLSPEVTRMVRERGIDATLTQQTLELTVVCCDLRGFTRYTEHHGAAQMAQVLREYYAIVVEAAKRYGGTVKDFAGDGALILIGAPLPRQDHAQAGLELARDLIRAVKSITQRMSSAAAPLGVGAGVASGPCAVGAIGSQSRLEYTAIGSAVNLAARLCAQSGDGEILISPDTANQVQRNPAWREHPMQLKGFTAPVPVLVETLSVAAALG